MQYIILYVNNLRKKYGIEQWPAELPNMHTKTISIHRWVPHLCLITEKIPFVNYFRKLWVLDISIKPNLLSTLHTFFTDYPTSTTLKLTTTPNQQINSFALSFSTHIQTVRCVGREFNFSAYDLWCHVQIRCFIYHYIPFCTLP